MFWLVVSSDSDIDHVRTLLWLVGIVFTYVFVSSTLMYGVPKPRWPEQDETLAWLWPFIWPLLLSKWVVSSIKQKLESRKLPKAKVIK